MAKENENDKSFVISDETRPRVPKICGADVELGNFVTGIERVSGTGFDASRLLLRQVRGVARSIGYGYSSSSWSSSYSSKYYDADGQTVGGGYRYTDQDWGRKFLPETGGCAYIDLDHLEICLPEVRSARDFTAAWHGMLLNTRYWLDLANERLSDGHRIRVLVNNSDGMGSSYGSHLNFLLSRQSWEDIFNRRLHHLLFLASFQVSAIVFTGQGKVGSENGRPDVPYQLAQRSDFFETVTGTQTTSNRPLVNSRDESLCGGRSRGAENLARLHCIFFDSNLADEAVFLKVGTMQIILSMIEAGETDPNLILDDPVQAVLTYSHDPSLAASVSTASGEKLTAVQLQMKFLERAKRFVESGGCEGVVPDAQRIVDLWEDTLIKLDARDFDALSSRLDWVLKQSIIEHALTSRGLDWDSPEAKYLDHMYSDLENGLFWGFQDDGLVARVVSDDDVSRLANNPPLDTRAWTRAMLLREYGDAVHDVDWDRISVKRKLSSHWSGTRTLYLSDPSKLGETDAADAFQRDDVDAVLDQIEQLDCPAVGIGIGSCETIKRGGN